MVRHRLLRLAWLIVALAGCRSVQLAIAKPGVWTKLREREQRWYVVAWGSAMPPAELDRTRRRFDCVWDALAQAGRDPRDDFDCRMRTIDFVLSCTTDASRGVECLQRSRGVCAYSREYLRAGEACR